MRREFHKSLHRMELRRVVDPVAGHFIDGRVFGAAFERHEAPRRQPAGAGEQCGHMYFFVPAIEGFFVRGIDIDADHVRRRNATGG